MARIGIVELYAATTPGTCPFCGDPLPERPASVPGRKPKHCGDSACLTAYFRTYQRTYRAQGHGITRTVVVSRGTGNTPPGTVTKKA